jgi:redox-sensitive bicupin YhaK (pirin superfamily)
MTAGQGIAHSERTPASLRSAGPSISGLQLWVALPRAVEEGEPGFAHHDRAALPMVAAEGLRVRVVAGSFLGVRSPVALDWEALLADVSMDERAVLPVSAHHDERALYLIEGRAELGGQPLEAECLYVLKPGLAVELKAVTPVTLALLGGEPMDGPRHIWWNFVSSSEDRIEQARADWMAGRFRPVPGEVERVDAPDRPHRLQRR